MNTDRISETSANSLRRHAGIAGVLFVAIAALLFAVPSVRSQTESIRFVPPDAQARNEAIGPTASQPPVLQRAFSPANFSPIPEPAGSDWLASHTEQGQTYQQYVRSRPNRPNAQKSTLYFQPVGRFEAEQAPDLQVLSEFASAFFSLPVKVLPAVRVDAVEANVRHRSGGATQILSIDVLEWLEKRVPDDAYCLLAITMQDLYPAEDWNFVFGQASLNRRVGVYSLARYHPKFYGKSPTPNTERLVLERSCKVLAHETGHMFGIKHCIHFHCLMNGSNHLDESDAQPIHLCPACLRKLQHVASFDVLDRYAKLQTFSESVGWKEEAEWISDQIEAIREPPVSSR